LASDWCRPFIAPIIGANCDPLVKIPASRWAARHLDHGFLRLSRIWHALCKAMVNRFGRGNEAPARPAHESQTQEHHPMKTLTIMSASLIISLSLFTATVIVPLSATPFIA
jgi:hypothetical protein